MPKVELLINGPADASWTVALAHGAGAAMDTPLMTCFAVGLANRGFRVARFEFPYMAQRRKSGKQRPPDREPVLLDTWRAVIEELGHEKLVIGGKSMGGRMASMVADEAQVAGLVCLGYPFHPAGDSGRLRVEHLKALKTPTLILQGARDPFGSQEEVAGYDLSPAIRLHWLTDGDHDFKPRRASGKNHEANLAEAIDVFEQFIDSLPSGGSRAIGPKP
ncbi:MAG TPA: alpha/beta fold hydrolase [Pirellulales bacterium]|nr:alpha/beta fold hydrolase [Pirellulales bacterium]